MASILLVDDSDALRTVTARLLQNAGYEVMTVSSGREAIDVLETVRPDLIITDINMPDVDGIEVILAVRDHRPELPIIAISGGGLMPPELLLENATAFGACHTIEKPFGPENLLATVRQALSSA